MAASADGTKDWKDQGALSVLRHCLNPKALIGLGAVGLVVWMVQPQLIRPILPVLFMLACPLSMVLMMRAMNRPAEPERSEGAAAGRPSEPVDRVTELRERLARARAEEEVVRSELDRLDASKTPGGDAHESPRRSESQD